MKGHTKPVNVCVLLAMCVSPGVPHWGNFSSTNFCFHVATCVHVGSDRDILDDFQSNNRFLILTIKITNWGVAQAPVHANPMQHQMHIRTPKSAILSGELSESSKSSKFSGLISLRQHVEELGSCSARAHDCHVAKSLKHVAYDLWTIWF